MTLSIWRYAHLGLAIMASLFLIILSITGVILAIDAVNEDKPSYDQAILNDISLSKTLETLDRHYLEVLELSVNYNQQVFIKALDLNGNNVEGYIDPTTGLVVGSERTKSQFIQWTTALHRSLFLKETGRVIVGVVSFLLFLITCSGFVLIIKRQQGIRHFFAKIHNDFFSQYFHVVSGRLLLIPIIIISLTGTYLFMMRTDLLDTTPIVISNKVDESLEELDKMDFQIFQEIKLSDVEKIEFPFIPDDPDEYYTLKLQGKQLIIHQLTGQVVEETIDTQASVLEKLNLDLHTGRTNVVWAIILGLASFNILMFIYTGFVITFKRTKTRLRNKYHAQDAEIIVLVGSENGSTLFFANKVHQQLLAKGKRSYIAILNKHQAYTNAKQVLLFTSTYGLGEAPSNASKFESLLVKSPCSPSVHFAVIGFGSTAYPDFCAYAMHLDQVLEQTSKRAVALHTVNDRSVEEFVVWVKALNETFGYQLSTTLDRYQQKLPKLQRFQVVDRTDVSNENDVFKIILKPSASTKYQSGDLLAIFPSNKERLYSVARLDDTIQLIVKLHENGFGSGLLYSLQAGDTLKAKVNINPSFHFPKSTKPIILIANGTGIAPFFGMIRENKDQVPIRLYAGFRYRNKMVQHYEESLRTDITLNHLTSYTFTFSREENKQYVYDLVREDADIFVDCLAKGGVVMICGAIQMQHDVERVLQSILSTSDTTLEAYKANQQLLTDCY